MTSFTESLKEYGVENILDTPKYIYSSFTNDEKLFRILDHIRDNNSSVLVHGDCDADGVFSVKILLASLDRVGIKNYKFFKYRKRSHKLSLDAVNYCIYNNFEYIIILDSSSNDMDNINKLIEFGVNVIIIDHHNCNYNIGDYPEGCLLLNTIVENRLLGTEKYRLSAGALTYYLMSEYLKRKRLRYDDLSAYALVTLYSDSIDMTYELNRAIYYMATNLPRSSLPQCIRDWLNEYNVFKRRFIEFTFVPKINACFRAERFDLINNYLFEPINEAERTYLLKEIKELHLQCSKMVNIATDTIKKEVMENIVLANLSNTSIPIEFNKLYNYTGLVANNLSKVHGKPCVVVCDAGSSIKGSFRDCLSRNYLKIFKQFCNAEGHNAAFGISIEYQNFNEFKYYIEEMINKKFFILGVDEPIEIEYTGELPDIKFLEKVALFNEFSGISVPIAVIKKKNTFKSKKSFTKSCNYVYFWGPLKIKSQSYYPLNYTFTIKPVLTKTLDLLVERSVSTLL